MRPLALPVELSVVAAFVLCGPSLRAQTVETLTQREAELVAYARQELHTIADALQELQQHQRAFELRLELWMDYDPMDALARQRTGFVKVGDSWRKDPNALVLDRDLDVSKSKLRRVDRDWQKVAKKLVAEHRALAEGWTELGQPERAAPHWRGLLRRLPGDQAASEALAIHEFEGFRGNDHDLRMLRRGRTIRLACDWLNRTEFPLSTRAEPLPLLSSVGIDHVCVETEHFRVWGTMAQAELETIAQDCERALLLTYTLMGVSSGRLFAPARHRDMVFLADTGQYTAVLDSCRSQFTADRFQFLRDVVDQCYLPHDGGELRVHKAQLGLAVARDQAVRGVVQDALGVESEGLWEGVGHMACGFLFGQTLTFLQEQLHERTSVAQTQRRLAPDLAVWRQIAQESAWAKSDTRTSELVLLRAAKFTNEQRVKAWAICDYLACWRPELMLELDASRGEGNAAPPDVEAEFERRTGLQLAKIDGDWRSYWARGDALREAMRKDPLADLPKRAQQAAEQGRQLMDAVNAVRGAARVGLCGYFLDSTPAVLEVRRYEVERKKAVRAQELADKKAKRGVEVAPVPMPEPPAAIGTTVLWSDADEPADAVAQWLLAPRTRDLLLAPGRDLFEVASEIGDGLLLGVGIAPEPLRQGAPLAWPRHRQRDVPAQVPMALLAAEVRQVLQQEGLAAEALVGTPMSLHFARAVPASVLQQVRARAFVDNVPVRGVVVHYVGAEAVPSSDACVGPAVPGLVAFVPLEPYSSGSSVEVHWTLPATLQPPGETFEPVVFTAR